MRHPHHSPSPKDASLSTGHIVLEIRQSDEKWRQRKLYGGRAPTNLVDGKGTTDKIRYVKRAFPLRTASRKGRTDSSIHFILMTGQAWLITEGERKEASLEFPLKDSINYQTFSCFVYGLAAKRYF